MRTLLEKNLAILAKLFLWRYHPKIVAITGSVGKTSTKEACLRVLQTKYSVRQSRGNYNNEIGLPLTIAGEQTGGGDLLRWGWVFFQKIAEIGSRRLSASFGSGAGRGSPRQYRVFDEDFGQGRRGRGYRYRNFTPAVFYRSIGAGPGKTEFDQKTSTRGRGRSKF